MNKRHLKEDFYFCEESDWVPKNKSRIFRLSYIKESNDYEPDFFVPMRDDVYVNVNHTDENAEVSVKCPLNEMRLARNSEIERYMLDIYHKFDNSFNLHHTNKLQKNFFVRMKSEMKSKRLFTEVFDLVEGFEKQEVYRDNERAVLNLLRSYYKCRVLGE